MKELNIETHNPKDFDNVTTEFLIKDLEEQIDLWTDANLQ
jgi:hypothetical protein